MEKQPIKFEQRPDDTGGSLNGPLEISGEEKMDKKLVWAELRTNLQSTLDHLKTINLDKTAFATALKNEIDRLQQLLEE